MNDHRSAELSDEQLGQAYRSLVSTMEPPSDLPRRIQLRLGRRRRARRARLLVAASAAVAAMVIAMLVVQTAPDDVPVVAPGPSTDASRRTAAATAPVSPSRTGPLPDGPAHQCPFPYNRSTLGERAWAVDATVTEVIVGRESARAVLTVHHWYRGGSGEQVTATVPTPDVADDVPPAYGIGGRLLMSGDRDGRGYVGFGCGFSRYYDAATAATWADVFR